MQKVGTPHPTDSDVLYVGPAPESTIPDFVANVATRAFLQARMVPAWAPARATIPASSSHNAVRGTSASGMKAGDQLARLRAMPDGGHPFGARGGHPGRDGLFHPPGSPQCPGGAVPE